jgi:hypothetical protein
MKSFVVPIMLGLILASCARADKGTETAGGSGGSTPSETQKVPRWDPMAPPDRSIDGGRDR